MHFYRLFILCSVSCVGPTPMSGSVSASTPNIHLDASTGKLTLAGASNISLDTSTGAISINNSTFGSSGIQLQYNAGTPRMYVGDGNNKYVQFDGTDVSVGEDSSLKGAADYTGDTTFWYMPSWTSLDGIQNYTAGSGSVVLVPAYGTIKILCPSTSGDQGTFNFGGRYLLDSPTWNANRKFKTVVNFSVESSVNAYLITGTTSRGFGFYYDGAASTWKAWNRNAGSITTTSITISTGDTVEAIFTAGTNIVFKVNGSTVATHTTNIPSGTDLSTAQWVLYCDMDRYTTGGTGTRNLELGEYKCVYNY